MMNAVATETNGDQPSFSLNIVAEPSVVVKKKASKKRKNFIKKRKRQSNKTQQQKGDDEENERGCDDSTMQEQPPKHDARLETVTETLNSRKDETECSNPVERETMLCIPRGSVTHDSDNELVATTAADTKAEDSRPGKKRSRTSMVLTQESPVDEVDDLAKETKQPISSEHAAYLAEFHARPYELDRRSGAVRKLPQSRPSQHLHEDSKDTSWESLGVTNSLLQRRIPHSVPTNIQCQSVPAILKTPPNQGVFVQAETGSGKTLAYALPCLQECLRGTSSATPRIPTPRCLVVVPTRELAYQTLACIQPLVAGTPVVPGILVGGGGSRKSEKTSLRKGLAVLIVTATRLLDHLRTTQALRLENVHTVVLDEADRLVLDPAHRAAIHEVWEYLPASVRIILVSATLPKEEVLGQLPKAVNKQPLSDWTTVTATVRSKHQSEAKDESAPTEDSTSLAAANSNPHQLKHFHLVVHAKLRWPALVACLLTSKHKRTVVFCSTCASVDFLGKLLPHVLPGETHKVYCLHGNLSLQQRQTSIRKFTDSAVEGAGVLVATDVAGRGLNLGGNSNNVTIIQYDPPSCGSDYVHRAGRAARAGAPGECLLFLLPSEVGVLSVLDVSTTAMSLNRLLEKACPVFTKEDQGQRPAEAFATQVHQQTETVVETSSLRSDAAAAFCAHVRAYPVKERLLKPYFLPKGLHLGHVARSFGLKGSPAELNKTLQQKQQQQPKQRQPKKNAKKLSQAAKMLEGMASL